MSGKHSHCYLEPGTPLAILGPTRKEGHWHQPSRPELRGCAISSFKVRIMFIFKVKSVFKVKFSLKIKFRVTLKVQFEVKFNVRV